MGAVMVVVALAMFKNYDIRSRIRSPAACRAFSSTRPRASRTPPRPEDALAEIRRRRSRGRLRSNRSRRRTGRRRRPRPAGARRGPEFVDNQRWFNTPGDRPLTLRGLRGRVVLVDFWTYSCINCIRTLPYLNAWDRKYRRDGLTIVGVHTPEFPFEREAGNVEKRSPQRIRYPVAQDNDQATWSAYGNQYWPAEYFIDAQGNVRFVHFGEGEYGRKRGHPRSPRRSGEDGRAPGENARGRALGRGDDPRDLSRAARAERFTNPRLSPGRHDFHRARLGPATNSPTADAGGSPSSRRQRGGSLDLNFGAGGSTSCLARRDTPGGEGRARRQPIRCGWRALRPRRGRRCAVPAPLQPGRPAEGRHPCSLTWNWEFLSLTFG